MKMLFDCYGAMSRNANDPLQDHFLIADLHKTFVPEQSSVTLSDELEEPIHGKLLVVADGQAGEHGPTPASRLAVECLASTIRDATPWLLDSPSRASVNAELEMVRRLEMACRQAHSEIRDQLNPSPGDPQVESAMTAILLIDTRLYLAHTGHSRCYRMHDSQLERLTHDCWRRESSDDKAGLWRCLGSMQQPDLASDWRDHDLGDTLLLCTDGLHQNVSDERIAMILRANKSAKTACEELIEAAKRNGGAEDATAVVMQPVQAIREESATPATVRQFAAVHEPKPEPKPEPMRPRDPRAAINLSVRQGRARSRNGACLIQAKASHEAHEPATQLAAK